MERLLGLTARQSFPWVNSRRHVASDETGITGLGFRPMQLPEAFNDLGGCINCRIRARHH